MTDLKRSAEAACSIEALAAFLAYEPLSGRLLWRRRVPGMVLGGRKLSSHGCSIFNTCYAGRYADLRYVTGYRSTGILKYQFLSHRIVWALHYGEWPQMQMDHINGVRSDNRLQNLRLVTLQENNMNLARRCDNKSGYTGVYFDKAARCWVARITKNGKTYGVGRFETADEAGAARKEAERRFGFHENHGRETSDV